MAARRKWKWLVAGMALVLGSTTVHAQELPETTTLPRPSHNEPSLRFDRLTTRDGLSQNFVFDSVQDPFGFMWFATQDGLNRYDGRTVKTYDRVPFDSTSLLSSIVVNLHVGLSGTLYVGTATGLQRFDQASESFEHIIAKDAKPADSLAALFAKPDTTAPSNPDGPSGVRRPNPPPTCVTCFAVADVLEAGEDNLWVGSAVGLARFDLETRTEVPYRSEPEDSSTLTSNIVTDLFRDASGSIWVATVNGINRMHAQGSKFDRYLYDPDFSPAGLGAMSAGTPPPQRYRKNLAVAFADDTADPDKIWVATFDGLVHLDKSSGESTRFAPPPADGEAAVFTDVERDPNNDDVLWLTTFNAGLYRFDTKRRTFDPYRHDPSNPATIGSDRLTSLYADRSGMLWVGSLSGGVAKLDTNTGRFARYSNAPTSPLPLSGPEVWAIYQDRSGLIWVGTNPGGLNVIDRESGTVTDWVDAPAVGGTLPVERQWIFAIHEDASGGMWLGTIGAGLYHRPRGSTSFRHYRQQPPYGAQKWVSDIFEDSDGRLWILSSQSVNIIDPATGDLRTVYDNFLGGFVYQIDEAPDGTFWVALGGGGLMHLDRDGGVLETFTSDASDPDGMRDNNLLSVHPSDSEAGVIWFGTGDAGLGRYDTASRSFRFYSTDDGLSSNIVYGILEDDAGMLWLSTNRGLSRFDPRTERFAGFGVEDGIQSEEFNSHSFYRNPATGEMFFGGVEGMNAFYPDDISPNRRKPDVVLTGLRLFNEPVALEEPISTAPEVRFEHWQKMLTFEYVGLHFADPDRNQYAYRLDGFTDDWVSAGTSTSATFTNLDPGRYTFAVKAANSDGVWNEEGTSIAVIISPPWWRTSWAYILYGLVLAGGIFATDRFMRRRVIARATSRMLEAENRRKSEELEHAREVQLSLLPQVPPLVPGVEIAAGMNTATEVGGDYYDFNVADDGALVVAIGDATGHGLSAGTVVSATKGIFSLVANEPDIELAMERCARGVRRLGLQKLFMAFALARIADRRLEVIGGGMPPALVYRTVDGAVDEISLRGLPLGSPRNGQYRKTSVPLEPGDAVLLMSDGFPELFNPENEMIGYERARRELQTVGDGSAKDILAHFEGVCRTWVDGKSLRDDVTFVVLKIRADGSEGDG